MDKLSNSKGIVPVLLLLYSGIILLAGLTGYLGFKEYQLKKSSLNRIAQAPIFVSPSPEPSTNDSDPIITCTINAICGGGSRQMKASECKNMICCTFDKKCGGPQFVTTHECKTLYSCYLNDGTCKLLASKSACNNYYSNQGNDPIMDCNSKTGLIKVKRSICLSYTDCPDGNGGYVFESQDSCKQRWAKLGNQITQSVQDFLNTLNTNSNAKYQQILQQYQQATNNIVNNSNAPLDLPQSTVPTSINFNGFIRQISPTAGHCVMDLTTGEQVCPPSAIPSTFQNHCIMDLTTGVQSCS